MSFLRCSVLGSMPGGENWSVNPTFTVTGAGEWQISELEAAATAILAIPIPSALKLAMGFMTTVNGFRLEDRNEDGTLRAVVEKFHPTPIVGTGTQPKTYQASIVLSLQTLLPGGRGRGRLYWPATAQTTDSTTLRLSNADCTALATGAVTWLAAIEDALASASSQAVSLCVWSRADAAGHPVAAIRVGNIIDTQRRRRDRLTEGYQIVAFT